MWTNTLWQWKVTIVDINHPFNRESLIYAGLPVGRLFLWSSDLLIRVLFHLPGEYTDRATVIMLGFVSFALLSLSYRVRIHTWVKRSTWGFSALPKDTTLHRTNYVPMWTLYRQIIQLEFLPAWSCVSLTRSTTSSEWKLFRFDKMEVISFQILLVDVTFYL